MKKSIFIAVLGLGFVVASYGQGNINFQNYYSSTQTTGVSYGSGPSAGLFAGPEISAILLYGASTDTSVSQMTPLASSSTPFGLGAATQPGAIGTGAGWFSGGTFLIPGAAGGTFTFAIEAIGTGYIGYSSIFTGATQATSTSPVPNIPAGLEQSSFVVNPVPEPTTLALAGLGGLASLVAFRRKQA
jgi:hypothetical protein